MSRIYRHIVPNKDTDLKASIVDLRYKTREVLKALERNETVTVLYHGKVKGVIMPTREISPAKVSEHRFFGMTADTDITVLEELAQVRRVRHDI